MGGTKDCFILNVMAGGHEFHDSVWCAGKDIPLSKMCDGEWMVPFGVANCGGTMAGFIKQDHGYSCLLYTSSLMVVFTEVSVFIRERRDRDAMQVTTTLF